MDVLQLPSALLWQDKERWRTRQPPKERTTAVQKRVDGTGERPRPSLWPVAQMRWRLGKEAPPQGNWSPGLLRRNALEAGRNSLCRDSLFP